MDSFWADMDVIEWAPDEKLFYLWVFTNQHLDICGCYQVSIKVIAHETGVSVQRINELIAKFSENNKIRYNFDNRELLILNWKKHNEGFFKQQNSNSMKAIQAGADNIKTKDFKDVVISWVGGRVAPTLPPTPQPKPKPEPEPKEEPLAAAASSQASTTPTPPAPVEQQQQKAVAVFADSEERIRSAFKARQKFLRDQFRHLNLAVEEEQCVAKYRDKPIGVDAVVLVLEWCKRVPRPDARSRDRPDEVAVVLADNDRVCAVFCGADAEKRLFCEVLTRLVKRLKSRGGLPQALSDDLLMDWFESLHPLGFERIAWGARHLIENQVFFPALAEFRSAVLKAPRAVVPVVRPPEVELQRAENGAQALADILASLDAADGPPVTGVAV